MFNLTPPAPSAHYVYVMQNLQVANFFKVGSSNDPEERLKKARTFCPLMFLEKGYDRIKFADNV